MHSVKSGKNVEKREHLCTAGGKVVDTANVEISMEIHWKNKNRTAI